MNYKNLKAEKFTAKFIGSMKYNKAGAKMFNDIDVWKSIIKTMKLSPDEADKALDSNKLPFHHTLSTEEYNDMATLFYEAAINTIYPNEKHSHQSPYNDINSYSIKIDKNIPLFESDENSTIKVNSITFHLFPYDIAFYTLDISLDNTSFNDIILYCSIIRNIEHYQDKNLSHQFLDLFAPILQVYNLAHKHDPIARDNVKQYYSILHKACKLKCYMTAIMSSDCQAQLNDIYTRKHLLYDIATLSPIGCVIDTSNSYCPAQSYYQELMSRNCIEYFENWIAISLVDTFLCLMNSATSSFYYNIQWGKWYYEYLYINVLYNKVFMLDINDRFITEKSDKKVFKTFNIFDKTFNHHNVSYNFLPNNIYRNMCIGLEVDDELKEVKSKISLFETREENKREKKLNLLIFAITVLSLASFANDGWEFILKLIDLLSK